MSFLNSVLSTIGGDGQRPLPQIQPQPKSRPQISATRVDPRPQSAVPSPDVPLIGQKRKAEDSLPDIKAKSFKTEQGQRQLNGTSSPTATTASKEPKRPSISTSKSALAVPYRGTSRPSPTSASPNTPTSDTPKAPPKKGTYAEIMARQNAAKVGVIKHKPKEATSAKKQILMVKKGILPKDAKTGEQNRRDGKSARDSNSPKPGLVMSKSPGLPNKKPQPSYKGTATPKPQPAYKGTMRPADSARRKDTQNDRSRSSSAIPPRRARDYESEEDEDDIIDDEEEEEGDYPDASSDDMEAGFDDVEEEETAAVRVARLEDAEELRRENQHKKEKEDRRKMLAAMAAKAPKTRY
ncbi:MAG: hypothetical protein Q9218_003375 [Villophora microphyllina]